MNPELWLEEWTAAFDETKTRHPETDPEDYYRSGRASKLWPDKEGPEWWAEKGPAFVDLWVSWRDQCGLKFAEFPSKGGEAVPAIELETWAYDTYHPGLDSVFDEPSLIVRSIIDRVMEDEAGELYIVDLKTGSQTPPWPLQLALNNLGLCSTYGVRSKWGGFWSARKGGVEEWFDLSVFTDDWLWDQVRKAKAIRDQQLFLANPNNLCKQACGVRQFCVAVGGTPFFKSDATMTQKSSSERNDSAGK